MKQPTRVGLLLLIVFICFLALSKAQNSSGNSTSIGNSGANSADQTDNSTIDNSSNSTDGSSSSSDFLNDSNYQVKNYIKGIVIGGIIFISILILCWALTKQGFREKLQICWHKLFENEISKLDVPQSQDEAENFHYITERSIKRIEFMMSKQANKVVPSDPADLN